MGAMWDKLYSKSGDLTILGSGGNNNITNNNYTLILWLDQP